MTQSKSSKRSFPVMPRRAKCWRNPDVFVVNPDGAETQLSLFIYFNDVVALARNPIVQALDSASAHKLIYKFNLISILIVSDPDCASCTSLCKQVELLAEPDIQ